MNRIVAVKECDLASLKLREGDVQQKLSNNAA